MSRRDLDLGIFTARGHLTAACEHAEDAAALVAALGEPGTTIRDLARRPPRVLWTEGTEEQAACESFDFVAAMVHERKDAR